MQQRSVAPSVAPTLVAATTQGGVTVKQLGGRGGSPSKVRWQLGDAVAIANLGSKEHRRKLGMFLRTLTKWQDKPRNGRMRICSQSATFSRGRKWSRILGMYDQHSQGHGLN
ncbi:hypothetical protein BV898_18795 [Hypsibius exemplaris]|uniref:Uncharacterized protein n=1 Tax=Hypsibius exemplaris TaxID=2072580 RepID=A0A9X6NKA5_HYPEX|nr:hypothetical protein BV898_18795 [Hypsibius exemplaris]